MHRCTFKKSPLFSAFAAALALGVLAPAAEAAVTLVFDNNATPDVPPLPFTGGFGASALLPFAPDTEFRVVTPYGSATNNGHKDAIFGGETWVFDDGGDMVGVTGTPANVGAAIDQAPISAGLLGFPICSNAGSCATLQQNTSFLQTDAPFSLIAPIVGSTQGDTYGAARANVDLGTNTLTVTLPVAHAQWAQGNYLLGSDPDPAPGDVFIKGAGPGVVLSGPIMVTSALGVNPVTFDFVLHGEHTILRDEPAVPGFTATIPQWELRGSGSTELLPPPLSVNIVVDGGTSQECASTGGAAVMVTANVNNIPQGDSLSSIAWSIDGASATIGSRASIFVPLGVHVIDVDVTTSIGRTASNSIGVAVADTTAPDLDVAFIDKRTGEAVSEVTPPKDKLRVSIDATDICDPEPVVAATAGIPVVDGESIKVGVNQDTIVFGKSGDIRISVITTDASGNTATGDARLLVP